jgi:hypothetical protein
VEKENFGKVTRFRVKIEFSVQISVNVYQKQSLKIILSQSVKFNSKSGAVLQEVIIVVRIQKSWELKLKPLSI